MHDGCTGPSSDGQMVVNKVRMMGFTKQPLPLQLQVSCHGCKVEFTMTHFETACPECAMVHGVTPCSAGDPNNVVAAGIGY